MQPTRLMPKLTLLLALLAFAGPAYARAEEPAGGEKDEDAEEAPPEAVGFALGDYYIKDFSPVEGSKTKLSFVLHASVASERADEFERLLENRTQRVRDQVIISSRLCDPQDFLDPALKMFRRRILVRIHRAVPELRIDDVYFSEFRYTVE